jgi:hypothetical protein
LQSSGEIDHLLVQTAAIIGGQACADPDNCSPINCPTVAYDTLGPRYMEFFGRRFFVKKVTCYPESGDYRFNNRLLTEDKVVAVASSLVGIPLVTDTWLWDSIRARVAPIHIYNEVLNLLAIQ